MKKSLNRGMSLAEVVIASTIITTFLVALVGVYSVHLRSIFGNSNLVKSSFLNHQSIEAIKFLRNVSWGENIAPLSLDTDYYLVWQNNRFELTTTNTFIDEKFERKVVLSQVLRDAQSNIVEVGGSIDPNIKKLVVTTSWSDRGATTTRSITTYIANLFDN